MPSTRDRAITPHERAAQALRASCRQVLAAGRTQARLRAHAERQTRRASAMLDLGRVIVVRRASVPAFAGASLPATPDPTGSPRTLAQAAPGLRAARRVVPSLSREGLAALHAARRPEASLRRRAQAAIAGMGQKRVAALAQPAALRLIAKGAGHAPRPALLRAASAQAAVRAGARHLSAGAAVSGIARGGGGGTPSAMPRSVRIAPSVPAMGDIYLDKALVGHHLAAAISAEQARAAGRPGATATRFDTTMAVLRPAGAGGW
ncbi:MAG: hypothetical protein KGK11_07725 [Sphingomonadales bacterium]|nr:hypothetical protein [Sphingomonadales bacterium]